MLLTACAPQTSPVNAHTLTVYAIDWQGERTLAERSVTCPEGAPALTFLLTQAAQPPADGCVALLSDGITVINTSQAADLLTLTLSDAFAAQTPIRQSLVEAGLTMLLTQLPDVRRLQIECAALPAPRAVCQRSDLLFDAPVVQPQEHEIVLYFVRGEKLAGEKRMVVVPENQQLMRPVVESLISGARRDDLLSLIPHDTRLLTIDLEQGVCFVNLSAEFLLSVPADAATQRLVVLSIVNSLTQLPGVRAVQLLVDGATLTQYGACSLAPEMTRDESVLEK